VTAFLWTVIVWHCFSLLADMRGARKHLDAGDAYALVIAGAVNAAFIVWAAALLP
jgi:hypothetical protein